MMAIYGPLTLILDVLLLVMIVHMVLSWLASLGVTSLYQPMVSSIWASLNRVLTPIYDPIRRVLPAAGPVDLAPLVAFVVVLSLRRYILPVIFGYS